MEIVAIELVKIENKNRKCANYYMEYTWLIKVLCVQGLFKYSYLIRIDS